MEELWLIGGDTRSRWTAETLEQNGYAVRTYGVLQRVDSPLPEKFGVLILPFPSLRGSLVRGTELPAEELLQRLDGKSRVYGVQLGSWKQRFESLGATVTDVYGSEPLTTENAVLTAEGAIELAMRKSEIALHGAKCLVIGYGRIGKVLAQKLYALQADVTVSARKAGDWALIEAMGMKSDMTGRYLHGLREFDFVFNTVPAPILSDAQLKQVSKDCILLELASAPFGCSAEVCRSLGLNYLLASGLPGLYAPKTAGSLYARCILRNLMEGEP